MEADPPRIEIGPAGGKLVYDKARRTIVSVPKIDAGVQSAADRVADELKRIHPEGQFAADLRTILNYMTDNEIVQAEPTYEAKPSATAEAPTISSSQDEDNGLRAAAVLALNHITNTESEFGIKFASGDALRAALQKVSTSTLRRDFLDYATHRPDCRGGDGEQCACGYLQAWSRASLCNDGGPCHLPECAAHGCMSGSE